MSFFRSPSRLAIGALLAVVAGVLGWLLLGFAGEREGRQLLPGIALAGAETGPDGGSMPRSTVEQLLERDPTLTRERVERMPPEKWRQQTRPGPFGSLTGEVAWFRVTLRNPGDQTLHGVLADTDFFLDRLDAWIQRDPGPAGDTWQHLQAGEIVPPAEKALAGREPAFPVTVPAHGERVVYLRAQDPAKSCYVALAWWPDQADFHSTQSHSSQAEGIYFGGLCALFCYNVVLWLRLRLRDIGYYSLYLGSTVVFILLARGYLADFRWRPASPVLEVSLVLTMALNGFFLTSLAREFLELKRQPGWAHWLTRGLQAVSLGVAASVMATPWTGALRWLGVAVLAAALTHVGLLVLAIWAWCRGVRQARYFLWAFGCLFAGSLPTAAAWLWQNSLKDMAMHGLMIGSALEMLLLSLATADRFARAQAQLVEETEQRRVIQEAYADELAAEVRDRTQELERANADKDRMLAVIGHDLRSPLTGLMRSADCPTAEFARETERTSRELLLMIEDLVLWAQMRAGTCVIAVHPAHALLAPAVALHRSLASNSGTELTLEVPEGLHIRTDLVLAQTLVRNLLANALKFAHRRVALRAVDDGQGKVSFIVTNDGPSLPTEIIARLAADQDVPMTAMGGLGLRLCREICVALGMRLSASAPAEGGAQFSFAMRKAERPAEKTGGESAG
jgi:signal transduction histidine kinase